MGESKLKKNAAFPEELVRFWEQELCVNFAIALARKTDWLLHVDWLSDSYDEGESSANMIPLRVYVADNGDKIFDVRGVFKIPSFVERTIRPLMEKARRPSTKGVRTRFYSEEKLRLLPLPFSPDEQKISDAIKAIDNNPLFLKGIPERKPPHLPAYEAAEFTFGRCAVFAQALAKAKGLPTFGLIVVKFAPMCSSAQCSEGEYFHSVVMHQDGEVEDAWGKAPIAEIASRFGVVEFVTSAEEHDTVIRNLSTNTPDRYQQAYVQAQELIARHLL